MDTRYEDALVQYQVGSCKKKKPTTYICIIYLVCNIYCIYLLCILYILYIAYICRIKSEWYINRTLFTTYIVDKRDRWCYGGHRLETRYEDALVQYQVGS